MGHKTKRGVPENEGRARGTAAAAAWPRRGSACGLRPAGGWSTGSPSQGLTRASRRPGPQAEPGPPGPGPPASKEGWGLHASKGRAEAGFLLTSSSLLVILTLTRGLGWELAGGRLYSFVP